MSIDKLEEMLKEEAIAALTAMKVEITRLRAELAESKTDMAELRVRTEQVETERDMLRESEAEEIARLREALEPFARAPYTGDGAFNRASLSDDDFRRARAALAPEPLSRDEPLSKDRPPECQADCSPCQFPDCACPRPPEEKSMLFSRGGLIYRF
jgi:hypothetical protein